MKVFPIYAMGVKAYCSDIIIDSNELETVYFLSVCGYQATVKGIIANLLENHGISIHVDGISYYLTRSDLNYKVMIKKMPTGLAHAVVYPKLALPKNDKDKQNSFYIFTDKNKKNELLSLFYRHLDEKIDIPLHPSWSSRLWQLFKEQEEWLIELKTLVGTYCGYSFEFNIKQLQEFISGAIKNREPDIIECIKWKGGNKHGEPDIS